MTALAPRAAHESKLERYRKQRASVERQLDRLGVIRLASGGIGFVVLIAVFLKFISAYWLLAPLVVIVGLSIGYSRLKSLRRWFQRAESYHERGLARCDDVWMGKGDPGVRYQDDAHLYAPDLDLFGTGSLFERLCTAHTRGGQDALADWLRKPADPSTVRGRQEAVVDLRDRSDLRERLALLGEAIPGGFETTPIAQWAAQPPVLPLRIGVPIIHALTIGLALAVLGWVVIDLGPVPLCVVLIVQSIFVLRLMPAVHAVLSGIERRAGTLLEVAGILSLLESETFTSPRLRELQESLNVQGRRPSQQIAELVRLIDVLNSRRNQLFLPIALFLMWGTRLAFAIDAWRVRSGPAVNRWFAVIAEVEALLALAAFAFENPSEPFPEIVDAGPLYQATGLRHPLMKRGQSVANDLDLGAELRLLVISGSNMSGKSTFLRTIGINAVLAFAGAPVWAERMRIAPLTLGATLRIQDSLMAGKSRFYAEITRIRQVMELAKGPVPLLFLFDEILHGTNSHDRGIGAAVIVRALVERGAIGLVTTHDLALAHVAEELAPRAANVHFADRLEDGEMVFDYRMQPGIVRHSNAIALMRAVGLPV